MSTEVRLPQWGMGMSEGCIVKWLKNVGDPVEAGDELVEVEAAKVNAVIEAPVAGVLSEITAAEGETIPVRTVVGYIAENAAECAASPSRTDDAHRWTSPRARRLADQANVDLKIVTGTGPEGRVIGDDVIAHLAGPPAADTSEMTEASREVGCSPLARRLADELGLSFVGIRGNGPGGQVVADDVRRAAEQAAAPDLPTVASEPGQVASEPTFTPVSRMRATIAERMMTSLAQSAQFTMGAEASAGRARELLEDLNLQWARDSDAARLTWTDLVGAAVARAAVDHPIVNSSWLGDRIVRHPEVNVGIAVSLDDGLVVPVIRAAERLSLRDLSRERARIADGARAGCLQSADYSGSTITVSALGRGVVTWFTPVLNPGEAAILGVGSITQAVGWSAAGPEPRWMLPLSLTVDHRVVDGRPAGEFLSTVVDLIENPLRLLT